MCERERAGGGERETATEHTCRHARNTRGESHVYYLSHDTHTNESRPMCECVISLI